MASTLGDSTFLGTAHSLDTMQGLNMTVYNWSALTNNQQIAFNPSTDKLTFDSSAISAASLSLSWVSTTSTSFAYSGKSVTLLTDVKGLTTTNVSFANGSLLVVGDNATATVADDSNNNLTGSAQADLLLGLGGDDQLNGGAGSDFIDGGAGPNGLFGAAGNDTLIGGAGQDYLIGGSGNDSMNGGDGTDTVDYGDNGYDSAGVSASGVNVNLLTGIAIDNWGGTDSLVNIEMVNGSNLADRITGDANGNMINGYGGNDSIDGGAGNDWLIGQAGDDLLIGGAGGDLFTGGSGNDTMNGGEGPDTVQYSYSGYSGAESPSIGVKVNLQTGIAIDSWGGMDTLIDIEGVNGSILDDQITGNFYDNQLNGDAGNDTLTGASGNDRLIGGSGNDNLEGGDGVDTACFDATFASSGITKNPDGSYTIVSATDGTDTLHNVEYAQFSDQNVALISGALYNWSVLTNNQQIAFNPTTDKLIFDSSAISAASLSLTWVSNTSTSFAYSGKSVTLLTNVRALTTTNVTFTNGSLLIVGDNETVTAPDDGNSGLNGSAQADQLLGLGGDDWFNGGGGNDYIDGGGKGTWGDTVGFDGATAGVNVNLTTGRAEDGQGGVDVIKNVQHINGTRYSDTLIGSEGANWFRPGSGNDYVDGMGGQDTVMYYDSTGSVNVNLQLATATGASIGNDILVSIEGVHGSNFADTIRLSNENNSYAFAGAGDDLVFGGTNDDDLIGESGNDTMDGGVGTDTASYQSALDGVLGASSSGVTVNLAAGTATDNWGGRDTLISIEDVKGSSFGDIITGDQKSNHLEGFDGDDLISGAGGGDRIDGGNGNDTAVYSGQKGDYKLASFGAGAYSITDLRFGSPDGADTLVDIERLKFSDMTTDLKWAQTSSSNSVRLVMDTTVNGVAPFGSPDIGDLTGNGNTSYFKFTYYDPATGEYRLEIVNEYMQNPNLTSNSQSFDGQKYLAEHDYINGRIIGGIQNAPPMNQILSPDQFMSFFNASAGNVYFKELIEKIDASNDGLSSNGRSFGFFTLNTTEQDIRIFTLDNFSAAALLDNNDTVLGNTGNDILKGFGGNDTIDGGAGVDTVVFTGTRSQYVLSTQSNGSYLISDTVAGRDGTDTVINTEFAQFSDQTAPLVTGTFYKWSTLTNNQQIPFSPTLDRLLFDDLAISAAGVSVSWSTNASVTFSYGGKTVTFTPTDKMALTTSNVMFLNGSVLVIGDNAVGNTLDDSANVINGSEYNDCLLGLGGDDVINAGNGNDYIAAGYGTKALGNDTINGGGGFDTLAYVNGLSTTPPVTVNLANHTAVSLQGSFTINSIENVYGTAQNDTFIGGDPSHILDSLGNYTNEVFRGYGGNDILIGGSGNNYSTVADYSNNSSNQVVIANLHTGYVIDGLGGIDTISNVKSIWSGSGNDQLTGGGLSRSKSGMFQEQYRGNAGNDVINGSNAYSDGDAASADRADYSNNTATQAINVNLATGVASDGLGGTDTLIDIDQVFAGAGNDTITGSSANEVFDGGAGNDTITGGGGSDAVRYQQSTAGVIVNLGSSSITVDATAYSISGMTGSKTVAAGTANDGMGGTDTLSGISSAEGSDYNDYLRGTDTATSRSSLAGNAGNNILVGGLGTSVANYNDTPLSFGGINASLVPNSSGVVTVQNKFGGVDTLYNIKGLSGSNSNDTLTGGTGYTLSLHDALRSSLDRKSVV